MTSGEAAKKLAENTWGLLLARFVSPILLTIALWLGSQYLSRMDEAIKLLTSRLDRQDTSLAAVNAQLAAMEASRQAGIKARDGDIADILEKVSALSQKMDLAATQVASVTAKVDILLGQVKFDVAP